MSEVGKGKFAGQLMMWDGVAFRWFPDEFPAPVQPPAGSALTWVAPNTFEWHINQPGENFSALNLAGDFEPFWGADTNVPTSFILPPRTDPVSAITRYFKDIRGNANVNSISITVAILTTGTTGTSDGSTTYTDPNATFITNGIANGDSLVVTSGPGSGTYSITGLISETQLTTATTIAADAGPASYQIYDRGFEDGTLTRFISSPFGLVGLTYFPSYGWRSIIPPEIPTPSVRGTVFGSNGSPAYLEARRPVEDQGRALAASRPSYEMARGISLIPTFGDQFFKLTSDGNSIWAIDAANLIVRFSKETGQQDFQISSANTFTSLICAAGFLWVMEDFGDNLFHVAKYSLTSPGTLLGTVNTGLPNDDGVQPIAFDGRRLFIPVDDGTGSLSLNVYDVYAATSLAGPGPAGLSNIQQVVCGNGRVVVSANSGLYVFNEAGDTFLGTYAVAGTPSGLAFDGTYFYYIDVSTSPFHLVRLRVPLDINNSAPFGTAVLEQDYVLPIPAIAPTSLFFDGATLWAIQSSPGALIGFVPSGGFDGQRDRPVALHAFLAPFDLQGNFGYPHFDGESVWIPGLTTGVVRLAPVKPGGQRKLRQQATLTTTPYNVALVDEILGFNTNLHAYTVNLPDAPFDSMEVTIYDSGGNADTNAITINAGAGQDFEGSVTFITIGNNFGKRLLFYNASLSRWFYVQA